MTQSQALSILKIGENVFLTGEPGSGKTYIVNAYVAYLRKHGIEPAITASTGIAATHIGGMTIHSWSGIGIRTKLDTRDLKHIASNQYITKRIRRTKVLIIEEVSMLTYDTLSMVDSVCRHVKQNQEPFGGMQVVFCGDFFQLPPVVKRETVSTTQTELPETSSAHFSYDAPVWKQLHPFVCYLTEQHRQEDKDFLALLSAIRHNVFGADHFHHIEARKIDERVVPDGIPKLFSHNADVDRINDEVLAKLPSEPHVFTMSALGPDALVTALKKGCLSPETLILKVGAAVMFTKNNLKEGFVNGTLGAVEYFDKTSGSPVVKVQNGRRISVEPMDWTVEENGRIRAQVSQSPLRLAWAITVHKSQGMTLDSAVMDLSQVFEFGQGYVALSRVRRLSGLYMLGWNARAFQIHPEILAKDKVFRQDSHDAETIFSTLSPVELQKRCDDFITRSDGKLRSTSRECLLPDTYTETLLLWNEGKTIAQIATVRKLKESTILEHIEKLVARRAIRSADLSRICTPTLSRALPKIHAAFREYHDDRLSPVFQKLNGEYSYYELRIAKLLLQEKYIQEISLQPKKSGFEQIRKIYPNTYQPWDNKQDETLRKLYVEGASMNNLSKTFGRKNGSIRSRLAKLGLD
jgi:hypothetical protein